MNMRTRVTAIPVMLAASLGLNTISSLAKGITHENRVAASLQPTGLEEINLTVEEDGVTGMPESIEAGRYLVNVTGPELSEDGPFGAIFLQLPEGVSAEQAYEDVMSSPDGLPSWYLEAHFGGGAVLYQGTESWGVIDFTPGNWVTTSVFGATLGVEFEVTGEMPTALPQVEATVTVDLLEMTFHITDGAFIAGDNVVTVHNGGAQLHFIDVSRVPEGTTKEQVQAVIDSFMTGTPPAADNGLEETDFETVTAVSDVSPDVTHTVPITLEPGTYFLACWAPDPETFMPHAMMGMWDLITVE